MRPDLKNIKDFPTLPATAYKIIQMALSPDVSLHEMASVMMGDVALASRVLKTVNSAYYSFSREITSISQAVVILGLNMVKNIALSLTAMDTLGSHLDQKGYTFLLNRSLNTAVAAEAIANATRLVPGEEAFLIGLFADLGLFVVAYQSPEDFSRCIGEGMERGIDISTAVEEFLRVNPLELGVQLAETWSLPEHIRHSIRYHKRPEDAKQANIESRQLNYIVIAHLGNLASEIYTDWGKTLRIQLFKKGYREYLNRSEVEADEMLFKLSDLISRAAAGFQLAIPPPRTYAHILEEANAELGKINIQYEQMYRKLMSQAAELDLKNRELSDLTRQLDEKNKSLQDLAAKDGLTGLYNHRYFQEFIAHQVLQAQRYGRSLSLIMLDIDHFKRFNDTYGHQFGDLVLKELAGILVDLVRKADIVARYGGEEFAVILADTDLRGALLVAEKMRVAVEKHRLRGGNDQDVHFTISLGASQLAENMREPRELIAGADAALYEAKRNGRNRVSAYGHLS